MAVHSENRSGILVVTVDNPPVNALSAVERAGLLSAMEAAADPAVDAVVIRGAGRSFVAGADISEFDKPPIAPHLPDAIAAIEACAKPVVAAIDGPALGGGLEIALGCHYRIATAASKLGLPEVTLGIVPGAGGTQRLPRLIAPVEAARMIVGGKPVGAQAALATGLIDRIVDGDIETAGIAFARELIGSDPAGRRVSERQAPDIADLRAELDTVMAETKRSARGADAPLVALGLVEDALTLPFAEGMARERAAFLRLRESAQAAALRHIFFAERDAARPPRDIADATPRPIQRVGVVGAGTMGTGIAIAIADAKLPVTLVELSEEALGRGIDRIAEHYRSAEARGRIGAGEAQACIALVAGSTDYTQLADCDLIIEAAFESIEVKHAIFAELDRVAKAGAVLATNTSYLDIDRIAADSGRATDVVGLHFFSPANVMKLLEVVRGAQTAPDTLATALAFAKRIRKVAVVAGVCNGFIGNRMLRAYTREAGLLLFEGATPAQVDRALTGFGMAMGPFAVADLSGIDIGYKARKEMPAGSFEPLGVVVHDALAEAGHLGRKSGSGFYLYDGANRTPQPNPLVDDLLVRLRGETGFAPRAITDEEIVERCMLALANEGGHILDEGIAARAGDIDVVYINGYGFPRHRGGPLYHVTNGDMAASRDRIASFAGGRFGKWWTPASIFAG